MLGRLDWLHDRLSVFHGIDRLGRGSSPNEPGHAPRKNATPSADFPRAVADREEWDGDLSQLRGAGEAGSPFALGARPDVMRVPVGSGAPGRCHAVG